TDAFSLLTRSSSTARLSTHDLTGSAVRGISAAWASNVPLVSRRLQCVWPAANTLCTLALNRAAFGFTDPTLTMGGTPIKAVHTGGCWRIWLSGRDCVR